MDGWKTVIIEVSKEVWKECGREGGRTDKRKVRNGDTDG